MLLDRFELLEELGRGASGVVYRARERSCGRIVAVKLLSEFRAGVGQAPLRVRLQREAQLLSRVSHPNVLRVLAAAGEREIPFLVTEYVAGQSLQDLLSERGALSVMETVSLMAQAARGLDAIHREGVLHRDIKPANLLVTPDGGLKIGDFSIASELDAQLDRLERDQGVWGSPAYLAPERWRDDACDGTSDLYSLGVVLYVALTREHPFAAESVAELERRVLNDPPRPIESLRPELPSALCRVVMRLLDKDPAIRFRSGLDCAVALEQTLLDVPNAPVAWAAPAERGLQAQDFAACTQRVRPRWTARRPSWTWSSVTTVVSVGIGLALGWGIQPRATAELLVPGQARWQASVPAQESDWANSVPPPVIELPVIEPPARSELASNRPVSPRGPTVSTRQMRTKVEPNHAARQHQVLRPPPQPALVQASAPLPVAAPLSAAAQTEKAPNAPLPVSLRQTAAPEPPQAVLEEPGRGVIEIAHTLSEGLIEVRLGGRRVALQRFHGHSAPTIASFRAPAGRHAVTVVLLSAVDRVESRLDWNQEWGAGEFVPKRLVLAGSGSERRLVAADPAAGD
jgi:serine/threonine protein kinase